MGKYEKKIFVVLLFMCNTVVINAQYLQLHYEFGKYDDDRIDVERDFFSNAALNVWNRQLRHLLLECRF